MCRSRRGKLSPLTHVTSASQYVSSVASSLIAMTSPLGTFVEAGAVDMVRLLRGGGVLAFAAMCALPGSLVPIATRLRLGRIRRWRETLTMTTGPRYQKQCFAFLLRLCVSLAVGGMKVFTLSPSSKVPFHCPLLFFNAASCLRFHSCGFCREAAEGRAVVEHRYLVLVHCSWIAGLHFAGR